MPASASRVTRLVGSALVLSLVPALAVVGPTASAQAHPGVPAAVFDAHSVGWATWRDMSTATLDTKVAEYRSSGYLVVDLDLDVDGGAVKASVVAQTNTGNRDWWIFDDLTEAQYTAKRTAAATAGMRQTDIESYELNGVRRYGAVWVENTENLSSAVKHDMTEAQFTTWIAQQRTAGRLPVAVDEYLEDGAVRYAGIFAQNTAGLAWELRHGLTSDEFGDVFDALSSYRMIGTDSIRTSAGQRFSGIWVANPSGRASRQLRNMTVDSYLNNLWRYKDEGFRVVAFERYDTASGPRYAAVWRENGSRYDWKLRSQVTALAQAERDESNVPGISVAVMHNGVLQYSRGFGHADIADDTWLDSSHVLGLGSVSKAVTGVLALELDEQNVINVNAKLKASLPTISSQHRETTLRNLADNTGCIQHYNEPGMGGFGTNRPYATSLASARDFWADPRVPSCTVGTTYHYSTHGYTLLCAALEQSVGGNTPDMIENRLTTPFNLGTLQAERVGATDVRRAQVYGNTNNVITRPDRSEKYCGGGMESTAPDLATFGHKLVDGKILTAASLSTMWTDANNTNYSFGWTIGSVNGHRVVSKSGSNEGTQAYLRVYPDDDIVVAVLSNRDAGGHNMPELGRTIGNLVLDSL
jgi:CubicO group peptidase (beta-lactamase class C family)